MKFRSNCVTQHFCEVILIFAVYALLPPMFGFKADGATITVEDNVADTEPVNETATGNLLHITTQSPADKTGEYVTTVLASNGNDGTLVDLVPGTTEHTNESEVVPETTSGDFVETITKSNLTMPGDSTTNKTLNDQDEVNSSNKTNDTGQVKFPNSTRPFHDMLNTSTMYPVSTPINGTVYPYQNDAVAPTIQPLSDVSCEIIENYGSLSFFYKYSAEDVKDALCRCSGYCEDVTNPQEVRDRIKKYLKDRLYGDRSKDFIAIVTAYSLIFIVGVTGNILTLIGLSTWMKQKSPTYGFIMSLSCSNLLLLCSCLPLKVTEYFHLADVFTEITCKLSYYLRDFILSCSVLTLTIISFERYYAICKPFVVQYLCTWSRARKLIIITWVISLFLAMPTIFIMKLYKVQGQGFSHCLPQSSNRLHLILYFTYFTGVLFTLPSITMSCTYGRCCQVLWRSEVVAKRLEGVEPKQDTEPGEDQPRKGSDNMQARKKVVRGLVCIVVLFIISWGPSLLIQLLTGMNIVRSNRSKFRLAFETLTYVSSAMNPYLFMTMSSQFCAPLRCFCMFRRKPETPQELAITRATEFTSNANGMESRSRY